MFGLQRVQFLGVVEVRGVESNYILPMFCLQRIQLLGVVEVGGVQSHVLHVKGTRGDVLNLYLQVHIITLKPTMGTMTLMLMI
ncbi:hypothetical protein DPMN_130994 [Dreissena polymorpha]|uniref:Uncharacterized protein n=1 Tax=Dreissena polymorpha TaxID=45954 RepID=A0A9D4H3U2_DREPO|nr:hypothetical protein DPMN_130994 [Dreissena polymorpha]